MEALVKFKTFVDEINLENGRNYKKEVLTKYKDNDCIKYFLQLVYDPFIVFGISEKKLNKDVGHQSGTLWLDYPEDSEIFEYLKIHNTGTDKDIWTVQQFKKAQICDECKDLFDKIITKNLVLGISSDTINSVFSETLCKQFKVQLAEKFFDQKDNFLEGKTFVLTTKIDGMRCIMMKENGNVTFWSRQGQPIEGLVDLEKEAKECFPDNVVFDGELIAKETSKEDTYKNTIKTATTKSAEKHNLKMMVFDYMPLEDFKAQHNEIRYWNRRLFLQKLWGNYYVDNKAMQCSGINELWKVRAGRLFPNMYKDTFEYFELLRDLYYGTDISKITEILEEQVANGEEGIMINIVDAPYEFKRTNNLLKVKLMQTLDLEIVDYFEGNDTFAGMLGGFIVRYKDNNLIRVGSGFEKDLREEIWKDPESYIGKIIEVQYFEETENANGGKSIRFPVFKDFRTDKIEADY